MEIGNGNIHVLTCICQERIALLPRNCLLHGIIFPLEIQILLWNLSLVSVWVKGTYSLIFRTAAKRLTSIIYRGNVSYYIVMRIFSRLEDFFFCSSDRRKHRWQGKSLTYFDLPWSWINGKIWSVSLESYSRSVYLERGVRSCSLALLAETSPMNFIAPVRIPIFGKVIDPTIEIAVL